VEEFYTGKDVIGDYSALFEKDNDSLSFYCIFSSRSLYYKVICTRDEFGNWHFCPILKINGCIGLKEIADERKNQKN